MTVVVSEAGSQQGNHGDIEAQRRLVRSLLIPDDPQDAMTAYYALTYDVRRVRLAVHLTPVGTAEGFAAVCQTGRDLFVPLVLLRGPQGLVGKLLGAVMQPGRPYTLITVRSLADAVLDKVAADRQRVNLVYVLDAAAYRPVVNVMVQPGEGPFRFEVRIKDQVVSMAGINWQSRRVAEMYVHTEPGYQGRGWGRAVAARCVQALLAAHLLPLYTVAEDNLASQRLASDVGFCDSGAREFECQGRLRG